MILVCNQHQKNDTTIIKRIIIFIYTSTNMSTRSDSPATVIRTTSDLNFEQAQHIYAAAKQITDVIGILEELCTTIGDHTSSWNKLPEKAFFVKKFVLSLISDTIITITATAKNLSPISGSKYIHQCNKTKRKREIALSNNTMLTPGELMIVQHVTAIKHNHKTVDITPAAKRHCRSTACVSPTDNSNSVLLPASESASGYNKMVVVNIMLNVPVEDCYLQAATMKAIAEHQKRHNVPCFTRTIYRLLERHANGKIISGSWQTTFCP
jgi:hypothetical protein